VIDQQPHISDLGWDRWLAGEVPADERERVQAHAASCARCAARLAELTARRDAFAARPVPIELARALRRRVRGLGAIAAIAAAAVAVFVLRSGTEPPERSKGGDVELVLAGGRPGALARLASGDVIGPGEHIQAGYSSRRDGFGAVLALDGAGVAMVYAPSHGEVTVALPAGSDRSFPESTVLDHVVGTERIWVLWCQAPHVLAPLVAQLRSTGQLAAPADCAVRAVTLDKRGR
jgi:anti-sigma factor RsiW